MVNKAAAGDPRSIQLLLTNQLPAIEARRESPPDKPATIVDILESLDLLKTDDQQGGTN